MDRTFSLDEARDLLDELRPDLERIVEVRAELATKARDHNAGKDVVVADIKALEARMSQLLDALGPRGVDVKGYAPLLLDFPVRLDDGVVLACWLENEPALEWYHELDIGFMGRRRLENP